MKVSEIKILPPRRLRPIIAVLNDFCPEDDKYTTSAVKASHEAKERPIRQRFKKRLRVRRDAKQSIDAKRQYADVSVFERMADADKKIYLVDLFDQLFENYNHYTDDQILQTMIDVKDIHIDDAVMMFYAMCDFEVIHTVAGKYYKAGGVPY